MTHPEILGVGPNDISLRQPTARVEVQVGPDKVSISFNDYLAMMNISYSEYIRARHESNQPNSRLFEDLHREKIQFRLNEALRWDRSRDLKGYEDQQGTRQEIEGFLIKNVNASGYGEAGEAEPQNDHFDKIDLFVRIDPATHKLPGRPVYFGIQHTALGADKYQKLERKNRDVQQFSDDYIPEHPEWARVAKIFYHEDNTQYFPEYGDQRSYDSILNQLKRKTGHTPKAHEAYMYTTDGKRNNTTEAQARLETVRRTYRLYQHIIKTLDEYMAESSEFFKKDFQQKKETLQGVIAVMEKENPELLQ